MGKILSIYKKLIWQNLLDNKFLFAASNIKFSQWKYLKEISKEGYLHKEIQIVFVNPILPSMIEYR